MLRMMMINRFEQLLHGLSDVLPVYVGLDPVIYNLLKLFLLQAIAAMMRAQEVDPTNLEVLLALGVSHTNG